MLTTRLVTAAVGLPVVLIAVFIGEPLFTVVVALVLAAGAFEICTGAGLPVRSPYAWIAAAASAALAVASHRGGSERDAVLVALAMVTLVLSVFRANPREDAPHWLTVAGAVLYVGWLGHYFVLVRALPDGRDWFLLGLLATFASDTGAYFVGLSVGRHHMVPAISPKKTWEGLAGGVAAAVAATVAVYAASAFAFDLPRALGLGAALAAVAPLGDLAESLLKRGMGVKDLSALVPGHGGVLDRLDSLLFTLPVVYFFVLWTM